MSVGNYRLIGELKVGDTFRLNTGEKLIVRDGGVDGFCRNCYFDDINCGYDCPWFSVVDSNGQFRNILYCDANGCNRSVYYEKVESTEEESEDG